ncbi:hypothetical protein LguiB_021912 [Lonicera macranthoides]
MGTMWNVVLGFKATIVMVVIQIMFAGANVLYKLAANDGLIVRIMVAYRFIFAAAFMVLLALYDERSEASATHSPYNVQPRYKLEIHKKGYEDYVECGTHIQGDDSDGGGLDNVCGREYVVLVGSE